MTIRRGEIWIAALDPTQGNWFLGSAWEPISLLLCLAIIGGRASGSAFTGRACERVIVVMKNESK